MLKYLLSALLAAALLAQNGGREVPPHSGPDHPGQPSWCQRDDRNGYVHNCSCQEFTYLRWPSSHVRIWHEDTDVEDVYFSDIDVSRDGSVWFHLLGHTCFKGLKRLKLGVR